MIILDKKYPATLEIIRDIHTDLKACLGRLNYNDSAQDSFMLSVSEIFANALKHTDIPPTSFKITLNTQGQQLFFTLMDNGGLFEYFDMMRRESEDQSTKIESGILETGGIGLFLSGRDFDSFTYDRIHDWNCYRLSTDSPFCVQKPLVLIIDDDPVQRDLLALYLSEDYIVQHAESGKAAMAWLEKTDKKTDLVLCDVVMREGNGVEFCMELQKDKVLALIPFIFMSGELKNPVAKIAENLPVNDFLQKPVQKDNVLKIIRRTLAKAQQDQQILGDRLDDEMTSALAPALPKNIESHEIILKWQAAEAGGGDIALHLPGNECDHIVVMDIMGHGAQAKFFLHSFAGYLHGFLSAQSSVNDPAKILMALSHFMHTDKIGEKTILTAQIVTIFKEGLLKIASAGHPAPLLCDGEDIRELEIEGAMPGLASDSVYESISLSMEPQQRLILYTDGLMEVGKNAKAMKMHTENMLSVIKSTRSVSINDCAEKIWHEFLEKTAVSLQDDALFVVIQRD